MHKGLRESANNSHKFIDLFALEMRIMNFVLKIAKGKFSMGVE